MSKKDEKIAALVAKNVRAIRLYRGMTQNGLGQKVGWKQVMVSQIESGAAGVGQMSLRKLSEA